ncbi:MAG: hypothetical protein DDT21_02286 [Syntrophomonadaceae bacterium]|nr:hypothetical protein [Bacillota bacterium]
MAAIGVLDTAVAEALRRIRCLAAEKRTRKAAVPPTAQCLETNRLELLI